MSTQHTFTRAKAGKVLSVIADPDDNSDPYAKIGSFCWYVPEDPIGDRWGGYDLGVRSHGITGYKRQGHNKQFCIISAEGDVIFIGSPDHREKIPGAGISSSDSKFWGRMFNIEAIGEHLYACGEGGQVYKRSLDGVWQQLDASLLQGPEVPVADGDIFFCIDGPSEEEIYVVGIQGKILFWNGSEFKEAHRGPREVGYLDIHVESPSKIWVCGDHGSLLCGNHRDGFRQVRGADTDQLLQSVTQYEGAIYLGAGAGHPMGIMRYDGRRLERVFTGLSPEVSDSHTVTAGNGVLWSVGIKDIVRFDGTLWERIDFPGNRPIR